jgi:hypothetical protein
MTFLKLSMRKTGIAVTAAVIFLGIWDLVSVLVNPDASTSISAYLVNLGFHRPMVTFAFGFLAGHIFSYMTPVGVYEAQLTKKIEKKD